MCNLKAKREVITLTNKTRTVLIASSLALLLFAGITLVTLRLRSTTTFSTTKTKLTAKASIESRELPAPEEKRPLIDPRTWIAVRVAASGPTAKQDDHWGECGAFTHYHESLKELNSGKEHATPSPDYNRGFLVAPPSDGLCHDDKTDEPIKERPTLPKPKFKPNPKAARA